MKQVISKDIGTWYGRWPKGLNNKMKSYVMYKTCSYNFKVKKKKAQPRNYFYELMFMMVQSLGEKGI